MPESKLRIREVASARSTVPVNLLALTPSCGAGLGVWLWWAGGWGVVMVSGWAGCSYGGWMGGM